MPMCTSALLFLRSLPIAQVPRVSRDLTTLSVSTVAAPPGRSFRSGATNW